MHKLRFIVYVLILAVTGTASYLHYRGLDNSREKARQSHELLEQKRLERDQLREEVRAAEARVNHLASDPLEVEAAIRDKKKYLRPGEHSTQIKEVPGELPLETPLFEGAPGGVTPEAAGNPAGDTTPPVVVPSAPVSAPAPESLRNEPSPGIVPLAPAP